MSVKWLVVITLLGLQVLSGCAWVSLSPQGEKVRVLAADEVGNCKRLGKTTAKVAKRVGVLERWEDKVQKELVVVASNSAAEMGGDTIVPITEPKDGLQTFAVYKCVNSGR